MILPSLSPVSETISCQAKESFESCIGDRVVGIPAIQRQL